MTEKEWRSNVTEEDRFFNDTAEVLMGLDQVLEEKLGSAKWEWDTISVIGEDGRQDPIWSLHLYVEKKKKGIDY
tara:strand:- start:713 stop:934 length:222 start_codon:yes stop_codon:yes gene_type:complete